MAHQSTRHHSGLRTPGVTARRKPLQPPRIPRALQPLALPATGLDDGDYRGFHLEGAAISGRTLGAVTVDQARLVDVGLAQTTFRRLSIADTVLSRCDLTGGNWSAAVVVRVQFEDCRLTGFRLSEASLKDVLFRRCHLSLANFRFLRRAGADFEACRLDGADFEGTDLRHSRFEECDLTRASLINANAQGLDLRGCVLDDLRGVTSLKGAVVDSMQLIALARSMAGDLGLVIREEGAP